VVDRAGAAEPVLGRLVEHDATAAALAARIRGAEALQARKGRMPFRSRWTAASHPAQPQPPRPGYQQDG
jgi:hypothetical protein